MTTHIPSLKACNVAVIIPTYNDLERLKLCLDAITKQTFSLSDIRVYVIDNNSSQDIQSLVQQYPFCQYLLELRAGAYNARNKGLNALQNERYVGFTDADCIPDENWISNAVKMLSTNDNLAIGGQVSVFTSSLKPNVYELYESLFSFPQQTYVESDNFAVTANLFTTRNLICRVGEFNAALFSGGDAEWGHRCITAGGTLIYSSSVMVEHPARNSFEMLTNKVKRTVGGCYQQRFVNPVMMRSFSIPSLLKGLVPPMRAIGKLYRNSENISFVQKVKLSLLLIFLKYHKTSLKILYKVRVIKGFERF